MAHRRSNFPARIQRILSGGGAAIPSLPMEFEPPSNVKAFIDRVIKSPLHDIDIPLSGFHWEYNKGNFHHWVPLFLHFNTYFKTYISCRKDLLLVDNMSDDDPFPKHSVLQILRVMQIVLLNCYNKSSFDGLEHFKLLLSSTDPDILLATLETLTAFVKINPSKIHGSGAKLIGCGSVNNFLLSLAQAWGSKEESLGLYSCVVANEKSQQGGFSLFPSDVEDNCSGNQYRMGSTLRFEYRRAPPATDEQHNKKGKTTCMSILHIPDLHLRKEDDLTLLRQYVEQYNVPPEHRFSLLTRIRYAHSFRSSRICSLYSRISILAFIVMVQSNDAHDELVSFFANEPEYTNELIRLVRSDDSVPDTVKALAMLALGAELAAYTASHEWARILSGSSTIISSGGNRMVLLTVLQKSVSSVNSQSDPSSILFVDALLQFFLLHVLSSSNSGSTIRGSGMIPPLLPLLQNTDPAHMHLVSSAVKNLQKLMEYSNPAVSLLKDLGGVELLAQRLQIEVDRVIGTDGESSSGFIPSDSSKLDVDRLCNQKRLIKVLLKALGSATYSPANSTRSSNSRDDSLPKSLSLIFRNASRFGGDIYFAAVTVMSEIIHKDPTCFTILHDLGLPDAFLSSVVSGVLPSSKALICIPGALGAICLNAKGLEAVRETASLRFLIDSFTTKKYLVAMNEGVVLLANAVEELLRHVSSLRSSGVDIIIEIISKLASTDVEYFGLTDKSDEETTMEIDVENKDSRGKNLVDAMNSDGDIISNDQFLQSCIFHTMVLVHRTVENSETCRLFVEKKGIDALMKLLLQPCIAQSSEGMPVALHSTVVFKGFTQHHSKPLAVAFCSALRGHLNKALDGFKSASDSFLLNPKTIPDSSLLSPLFVIEFLLFLGACKDHRWVAALLIEFGNESKDVLENIGRVHREVLWQVSLLEDSKVESEVTVAASASEAQTSDAGTHDSEEQAFNSLRQDSRLRRRLSGWSIESQFLDLISMYRDIGHASRSLRRMNVDVSTDSRLVPGSHTDASASFVSGSYGSKKETDKQKSYNSSCCDMMKSLSYHMNHLFLELGKAMMLSSRHGSDSLNVPSSVKSVVSLFSSIVLDYLNYRGPTSGLSETDISTKCRYLGKVIDFIDTILLEKPESCNPILLNCFYGCGVVTGILTTFEATSQLLFAVNKAPASPMETDEENMNEDRREVDYSWIYGPLASFGTLMDHLVTSSFIISSSTKQLLEQPIFSGDSSFPRDAEAFVKLLQSKVLKAVLPIWNHPHFAGCNYEFITRIISIMRHVYSGVEVRNVNANNGMRISGPPPDESTISLISEMGFSRSRAEEALTQVGANSVELATDWLFSHPEEPQEDDELARALRLSMGSSNISSNEDSKNAKEMVQEVEMVQLPPVDELLPACIGLLQANESLAFPVKNLLLTISSQNDGECRQRVLNPLIERLRVCAALPDASSCVLLYALFHIFALILNEDKAAREVASKSGLVSIALNLLSQWVPVSCDREKLSVPRWIISSFLAIDLMLQLDSNLSSEVSPEKVKNDDLTHQTQIHTEEIKKNELPFSFELTTGILEPNDKRMLIEISCKCIKNQLPSDTMHVVLRLCATLTKDHSVAVNFLELGGLPALLTLPTKCLFPGFDNVAASIIRHILEDPHTLQQTIESEIRHSFTSTADRHSISRVTPRNFVQSLSSVIARDPVVFMRAAKSICQIEMTGERPYIVLLKDRDKEKVKDKDKDKLADKEKQSAADLNVKNVKVHRKSPQSFTNVIEILLDSITMFLPSNKLDEPIDGALHPPSADMDIDSTSIKGKGKAVATVALDGSKVGNQEDSTSLAKSVFVLKLLTEIILTYHSSVNVLLRRDTDVSNSRALQRGISVTSGGGIFHHLLHRYLPYPGSIKKDKKKDDWRQKLTSKAKQFLVASSLRSTEGRKRIMSEVNNIFLEFIDLSNGCITPDIDMQTLIDLLNDILAARTSTGSYICTEASSTFIDVGLVQSLTRILQVLDLDHADSPKAITGMIKALELVTKEHAHSSDPNSTKGDSSAKVAGNQNEHDRSDNNENRLQSLETSSQPDHNRMMTDLVESLDAIQASGSSDSVTDMDHERDLDVGFVPDGEDFFMHEMSESGRSGDNNGGIANVEISFDIPHNVDNLDDDDDEEMSGDEEVDEDDEDDENNDTDGEEMRHHMSHPETDQDDHDIDEAFDEVLEEEEDDEDDEDGVILRLEEGINGINVFDQIDLFGLAGGSFSNESLRSMPFEVFGSRRQDRNASIYNLMGRAGGLGSSLEHPLLTDPSSLRHLAQAAQQRLSENTVDAAFSDRNTESDSSRLDTVFRSLRSGRHSHRFNTWVDVTRQRGSSNANVPQGIEELLVSQLRRPQPEQTPEQVVSINHPQEPDKDTRQNEPGIALEEVVPAENTSDVNLGIGASNSETNRTETVDVGPADGDQLQELGMRSSNDQVIDMQYEQSDLTGRDVEAVSLESGGSSATLGESLRSLEVEIGSADGHDDGGERQGDATRTRRLATTTIPLGSRDISLESVNEVSPTPNPSGGAGQGSLVNQQNNTNTESGSIDPTFLDALPEELRAEVLSSQQNQVAPPPNDQPQSTGDIDPEFLAALPQDIRAEVLAQQQTQRLHQSQELGGQPIEMDTVSIIATFPSDLREEVLLTSPDAVLASLTPALVTEANMLRERFAHRYHSGTPFGMYPRNRRGQHSRRNDLIGSSLERSGASSHRHLGIKMVEADGSPLVDMDALKALIRLFRVVQPLYRGQLQKLLLNLCAHHETRSSLVKLFMDMLIPDVHNRGDPNCINTDAEPLYRLYACHSHIIYSRPQFSDGVPPLVSRRILETLTYLAKNNPKVARLLLHLELPRPQVDDVDFGRGKAVMVMEEDKSASKKGDLSIVLILSLLNQSLYLRSAAHLEQLLSLLEVIIANVQNDLSISNKTVLTSEQISGSNSTVQDASANADLIGSSSQGVVKSSIVGNVNDTHVVLLNLPQEDLRRLCSLLAHEGLSESAYTLVAEVLKKLVAIVPDHCHLFVTELADSVQKLSTSAMKELQMYEKSEKTLITSCSDGTAILRVLQALSSLASFRENEKNLKDALSHLRTLNASLEPLWSELSNCISKMEFSSESTSVTEDVVPVTALFSNIISTPPLPVGTQNILPYIESFFVACEKLYPGQSSLVPEIGCAAPVDIEDATTSGTVHKLKGHLVKVEEKQAAFVKFSEKHRKMLNSFIRQNPGLLDKSFSLMLKVPRFIDFDNKRAHFRTKIKHQHDHHHSSLRISVRRAYILEDSYNQLRMRLPQDLKGRLTVNFQGEEGIDAGGLTREWYQVLSRVIFDRGALLFTTVGNDSTFQPNPNSVYQTEHLSYFKFVGRVVAKALFDGQLLDVHFTRSFYKHILGVKVTYHDIEAIDPAYYKNLKWTLENDISDGLGLTFSIDADEEQLILYEKAEVSDYELIPGGRNIRVTEENKHQYVDLVAEHRLTTAIRPQINSFMEGFNDLISKDLISVFNDKELELLISGLPYIDLDDLRANTEYSGYSNASPVIQWFWEVVQGFSKEDKARLLQFVTGTSKVPLEGFSALQGISGSQRFQIHKAYGSKDHLPSAHTCFNQLDLPEYPSKEKLQERLFLAIHEANEGFGFG